MWKSLHELKYNQSQWAQFIAAYTNASWNPHKNTDSYGPKLSQDGLRWIEIFHVVKIQYFSLL